MPATLLLLLGMVFGQRHTYRIMAHHAAVSYAMHVTKCRIPCNLCLAASAPVVYAELVWWLL